MPLPGFGAWRHNLYGGYVFLVSHDSSLCISVQAGCRFGCTFCNTGKMGLKRNLLPHEMLEQIRRYWRKSNRYVSIVYCLLADVNDSDEDADALISFAVGLPCKINLLSFNEVNGSPSKAVSTERFEQFKARLRAGGISVLHRKSLGTSIRAGCGQLGTE